MPRLYLPRRIEAAIIYYDEKKKCNLCRDIRYLVNEETGFEGANIKNSGSLLGAVDGWFEKFGGKSHWERRAYVNSEDLDRRPQLKEHLTKAFYYRH